jgi:hypothetical protein
MLKAWWWYLALSAGTLHLARSIELPRGASMCSGPDFKAVSHKRIASLRLVALHCGRGRRGL